MGKKKSKRDAVEHNKTHPYHANLSPDNPFQPGARGEKTHLGQRRGFQQPPPSRDVCSHAGVSTHASTENQARWVAGNRTAPGGIWNGRGSPLAHDLNRGPHHDTPKSKPRYMPDRSHDVPHSPPSAAAATAASCLKDYLIQAIEHVFAEFVQRYNLTAPVTAGQREACARSLASGHGWCVDGLMDWQLEPEVRVSATWRWGQPPWGTDEGAEEVTYCWDQMGGLV